MRAADSSVSSQVPIQATSRAIQGGLILYDAEQGGKVHDYVFTPSYWRARDALGEPLGGRGAAWRITDEAIDWVLRFYRRGGLPGKLIHDSYFYTGIERTRPWREWHLLAWMWAQGLPVPRPVAARVWRTGLSYRGALITETVPGRSLAALIYDNVVTEADWSATGACIRRLHDLDVWHADLNANNILVGKGSAVHLIDFDRARIRTHGTAWSAANLARLRRSLDKLFPQRQSVRDGWSVLTAAYQDN